MAGYYVRRGEKIAGPFDSDTLKKLVADGKVIPTDELSQSPDGPWKLGSQAPKLFPRETSTAMVPVDQAVQLPVVEQETTPTWVDEPATALLRVGSRATDGTIKIISVTARSVATVGKRSLGGISSVLQRRHELKMAEIEARKLEAQARLRGGSTEQTDGGSQSVVQHVTVNVGQASMGGIRAPGGEGCGKGCGTLIIVLFIVYLLWIYGYLGY